MSSFIYSNLYHIKEWYLMTPTVGTYTLIVQMCVKSRVGYLPREAGTIGHKFSFKKTELKQLWDNVICHIVSSKKFLRTSSSPP